jgi:hypothetical protein
LEEPKAHLFISYARKDSEVVRWVASRLEASGYAVWMDRAELLGGTPWQRIIPREIRSAEALLLMLTPNAVHSEWVRREFFYALRKRIRIIPIVVKPAEPGPEMQKHLSKIQTVVLWNRRRNGFADLLKALGGLRGLAAQVPEALDQAAVKDNTRLIAELLHLMQTVLFGNSHAIFTGGNDWAYYIQFQCIRDEPEVYAEAVGNKNLQAPYQLNRDKITMLVNLKWEEPDKMSSGNYRRVWEARSDDDRTTIAGELMRTFLEVYDHPPAEELQLEVNFS